MVKPFSGHEIMPVTEKGPRRMLRKYWESAGGKFHGHRQNWSTVSPPRLTRDPGPARFDRAPVRDMVDSRLRQCDRQLRGQTSG